MNSVITVKKKRIFRVVLVAVLLLSIPLVAMLFTTEVNWKVSDFLVGGILLVGTGLVLELILRKVRTQKNRIVLFSVALIILCLV